MYTESVKRTAKEVTFKNKSILVTGATGLIGSCLIDVLIAANDTGAGNKIYALGRSLEKLTSRFGTHIIPIIQDITLPLTCDYEFDYIFHCASNADPNSYAIAPVETILTNILGNKNVFDYCRSHKGCKVLLTSTFEVYGEIPGIEIYSEAMSGIIDQTILRNGYPESKRSCELLLRSYVAEYDISAVIARLPSVYGPTMSQTDNKAHAQFIRNAVNGENIILKSSGEQRRTYCYVIDAVSALIKIISSGKNAEAYNVSNENSIVSIAELAKACATIASTEVIFELPDEQESKGFSKAQNCILDNTKLENLGWKGKYNLTDGLIETIEYLKI